MWPAPALRKAIDDGPVPTSKYDQNWSDAPVKTVVVSVPPPQPPPPNHTSSEEKYGVSAGSGHPVPRPEIENV